MESTTANYTPGNSTQGTTDSIEDSTTKIQIVLYSIIFVLSIFGNGAMLLVLRKRFRLRSSNDLLLLNMVISEAAVVGICVPFDLILLQNSGRWIFGRILCRIIWPLQTLPYGVLVWTLMFISIQRFEVVAFPLKKQSKPRKCIMIVVSTWLFSLVSVTPYAAVLEQKDGDCVETWGIKPRRAYTVALFVTQYAIPLVIIAVCYTVIGFKMQETSKRVQQHITGKNRALSRRSKRQRMLVRMIALFVVVFATCMLPHHVVWLLNDFGVILNYSEHIFTFAYVFTFTSTLANPVIYFTHNSGFKKDLMSILCPCVYGSTSNKSMMTYVSTSQISTGV